VSVDWVDIVVLAVKAFILANLVMVVFAMMTWVERRLIGKFQYRRGPNRVGPFGLLQPIADLLKLIRKENFRPEGVSGWFFIAAPVISLFCALAAFVVIPFGRDVTINGYTTPLSMAGDLNVAVLYAIAMSSLAAYGVIIGGWASNSKFALLGALRACAQMVSYEVALSLAVLPVIMMSGTLSMTGIVGSSSNWAIGGTHPWYVVWAPLSFVVFILAALAESNRAPFDMAEAEQELVAGFHTEFGGLRYALFANAEYIHMITISALGTALFLGGWYGPGWNMDTWGPLLGVLWFLIKMGAFLFFFIWIRATLPRLRYDRLMRFGWKALLPVATVQVLVSAAIVSQHWGYQ
jgi:NADH-quinone oxidoreductase subunit H